MSEETLPPGWAWATVDEMGRVQLGRQRAPEHHRGPHMRKYLRVANVFEDAIDTRDVMEMNFSPGEFEQFRLEAGDILLNEGQSRELVGRPAMFHNEVEECCFTNSLVRFRAGECVVPELALYLFRHWLRDGTFTAIANITTNIAHLGAGRFAALSMPVPPLAEQRRIVAALDEALGRVRAARASLDEAPSLLERARQAVLAAAFRGELTEAWRAEHPEVETAEVLLERIRAERRRRWEEAELAKITAKGKAPTDDKWKAKYEEPATPSADVTLDQPATWAWTSLDQVIDPARPLCYGVVQPGNDPKEGVPLVRVMDLDGGTVRTSDLRRIGRDVDAEFSRSKLLGGELLISIVGTIGRVAIAPPECAGANIARAIARVSPQVPAYARWLLWWLSTATMQHWLGNSSVEVARATLNLGVLACAPVPVAPIDEASRVVSAIDAALAKLDAVAAAVEATRAQLDAIERAVLAKAFRGELVAQDAADEPAAEMLARLRASRDAPPTKRTRRAAKA